MDEVRVGPTNNRSVVDVMNEFAFLGEARRQRGVDDLEQLSLELAGTPVGPLRARTGFPDLELGTSGECGSTPLGGKAPVFATCTTSATTGGTT